MRKTSILLTILFLPMLVFLQVRYTLKGKVTDAADEALIGATVNIGGTLQEQVPTKMVYTTLAVQSNQDVILLLLTM